MKVRGQLAMLFTYSPLIWPSWLLSHSPLFLLVPADLGVSQGLCQRKYLPPPWAFFHIYWMSSGTLVLSNTLCCFPIYLHCDLFGSLPVRGVNMHAQVVIWNQKAWDYFPTSTTTVLFWLHTLFNKMFTVSNSYTWYTLFNILSLTSRYRSYHMLTFASFSW